MTRFLLQLCKPVFFPLGWTIFTIVLLCLPGSTIPSEGLFSIPDLDKIVHVMLFGGIVLFWGYYRFPALEAGSRKNYLSVMTALAFLSISLGIVLEILQYYVIPNRDFDLWDVVADAAGAVLAVLILWRLYAKLKKKI